MFGDWISRGAGCGESLAGGLGDGGGLFDGLFLWFDGGGGGFERLGRGFQLLLDLRHALARTLLLPLLRILKSDPGLDLLLAEVGDFALLVLHHVLRILQCLGSLARGAGRCTDLIERGVDFIGAFAGAGGGLFSSCFIDGCFRGVGGGGELVGLSLEIGDELLRPGEPLRRPGWVGGDLAEPLGVGDVPYAHRTRPVAGDHALSVIRERRMQRDVRE